jgi:hypothetical protein
MPTHVYVYVLTARGSVEWHHCNPDMARWRRNQIIDRASDEAIECGFDSWRIFDVDEHQLAYGASTDANT